MDKSSLITYDITFKEPSLGLSFVGGADHVGAFVDGFYRSDGQLLEAENSMKIALYDRIVAIQGKLVVDSDFDTIGHLVTSKKRPIRVTFGRTKTSSPSVNSWEVVIHDDTYTRLYLSFLKRKQLYLCTIWMQFLLAVNKHSRLPESEKESYLNKILKEYVLPGGRYSALFHKLQESNPYLCSIEHLKDPTSYIHTARITIKQEISRLSWEAFISSPEYVLPFLFEFLCDSFVLA